MTDSEMDAMIRVTILFEYCKRFFEQSDNPEMHFYVIPELHDTDNEIIKVNAVHLIDENLVRGGVDDDGAQTFPWIRRITPTGMELVQRLADESESNIPDLHDRLKDKADSREKILDYIAYCLSSEKFPTPVLNIVKDIVS